MMSKQKKNSRKLSLEKIVFATALFELIQAIIDLIKTLLE